VRFSDRCRHLRIKHLRRREFITPIFFAIFLRLPPNKSPDSAAPFTSFDPVGFAIFATPVNSSQASCLSGGQGMIVWWSIGAGVHVEPHSHPNEQIVWMLKGKMEFRLGSEQRLCSQGDVVVIPGGTEHEAWFREDTEVIDFFAPPRAEFLLGGKPAYMREDSHTSNQSGADE
jgi:quercetin dioxygenase-like cupin family protein